MTFSTLSTFHEVVDNMWALSSTEDIVGRHPTPSGAAQLDRADMRYIYNSRPP